MNKLLWIFLLCLGYGAKTFASIDDYNQPSFRIGTWRGSSFVELANAKLPKAKIVYFKDSNEDLMEALRNHQIDGFLADRITAKDLIKNNPDLMISEEAIDKTEYAMSFRKEDQKLRDEFAIEIKKMKADGSLKKLQEAWFSDNDELKVSTIAPQGEKGLLKVGTSTVDPPFSFFKNDKLVGAEIELVNRVAKRLGYSVEWSIVPHVKFISALQNKEIDINAGLMTITPERSQQILFGEPDYEDTVIFVLNSRKKDTDKNN